MTEKAKTTKAKKLEVTINKKKYNLDSDNKDLLDVIEEGKSVKNPETGRWEKEDVPFLPIEIVYQLLEGFFTGYNLRSPEMGIGRSFNVTKKKWGSKEEITSEVFLCEKVITLELPDGRTIDGTAKGVATIGQLTVDQTINWLDMRLEARAIKNACKKLGKIFRLTEEDEIEKNTIKQDAGVESVEKIVKEESKKDSSEDLEKQMELVGKIKDLFAEKEKENKPTNKQELLAIATVVKEELGIGDGTPEKDLIKAHYTQKKEEYWF